MKLCKHNTSLQWTNFIFKSINKYSEIQQHQHNELDFRLDDNFLVDKCFVLIRCSTIFHRTVLSVCMWSSPCFDNFVKLVRANTVFVSFFLSLLCFSCVLAMCPFKFDLLANVRVQTIHSFATGIFAGIVMNEWSWDHIHFIARLQFFLYGDAPLLSSNIVKYLSVYKNKNWLEVKTISVWWRSVGKHSKSR